VRGGRDQWLRDRNIVEHERFKSSTKAPLFPKSFQGEPHIVLGEQTLLPRRRFSRRVSKPSFLRTPVPPPTPIKGWHRFSGELQAQFKSVPADD